MKKVLFICTGNICRSAMAEGILRDKIAKYGLPLSVDSAGTHSYHNGEPYDSRACDELRKHHIEVEDLRSRRIRESDFDEFDVLLAADYSNLRDLRDEFGKCADKVKLMTHYCLPHQDEAVPDPYYGGKEGFAAVYRLLEESIDAWLQFEGLK